MGGALALTESAQPRNECFHAPKVLAGRRVSSVAGKGGTERGPEGVDGTFPGCVGMARVLMVNPPPSLQGAECVPSGAAHVQDRARSSHFGGY